MGRMSARRGPTLACHSTNTIRRPDPTKQARGAMLCAACDEVGLENNEAGWLVGWVMECFEKGWLTTEQTGDFKIKWGDVEATKTMLHMIAKREGFGDLLAEGVKRASEKIGGLAAAAAIYTMKGNTPRGHDHRTRWSEMFDTCVSNTSTIETQTGSMGPNVQGAANPIEVSTAVAKTKGLMQFAADLELISREQVDRHITPAFHRGGTP